MNLRYYLKRIKEKTQFMDDNVIIIKAMKEVNPQVYECAYMIANFIDEELDSKSTEDEMLYLMMHINRIIKNTII